jgi:hypothetical protein
MKPVSTMILRAVTLYPFAWAVLPLFWPGRFPLKTSSLCDPWRRAIFNDLVWLPFLVRIWEHEAES